MTKYSVRELLKARWGWRDLKYWGIMSTVQTGLGYVTTTFTLTNKVTGAVTVLSGLPKLGLCAVIGGTFWAFLYFLAFLGSLTMCALVAYGAKKDHPGYRHMYMETLDNE